MGLHLARMLSFLGEREDEGDEDGNGNGVGDKVEAHYNSILCCMNNARSAAAM